MPINNERRRWGRERGMMIVESDARCNQTADGSGGGHDRTGAASGYHCTAGGYHHHTAHGIRRILGYFGHARGGDHLRR